MQISIVIPSFEAQLTISKCMDSLLKSIKTADEIILVDDGSKDRTVEIASKFPCKIIKLKESQGPSFARNLGAKEARGEIIFFLDSDIELKADAIECVRNIFLNYREIDAVHGNLSPDCPHKNLSSQYKNFYMNWMFLNCPRYVTNFFTSASAIKKEIFLKLGGFNENIKNPIIEDRELGYRITKNGYKIAFDNRVQGVHYKKYNWHNFIETEYRRARDIIQMKLEIKKTLSGSWHENIPIGYRLSSIFMGIFLISLVFLVLWRPNVLFLALIFPFLIPIINYQFLKYIQEKTNRLIAAESAGIMIIDILVIIVGIFAGINNWYFKKNRILKDDLA